MPSSLRRRLPPVVLAAGALASIATSMVQDEWPFEGTLELAALLDDAAPDETFGLTATLGGTGPVPEMRATFEVNLTLQPDVEAGPALIRATLRSLVTGEEIVGQDEVVYRTPNSIVLELPAWERCIAIPCEEEFVLIVERADRTGDAGVYLDIDITGFAIVSGDDADPPDHVITVTERPVP